MSRTYRIAVIPGDGTGPEVVAEGIKVLKAASRRFGFSLDLTPYDFGGDRYLRTGETLPDGKNNVPTPVNKMLTETLLALTDKEIPLDEFARKPEKLLSKIMR